MWFSEYFTGNETQNGCTGAEWLLSIWLFTLMMGWLGAALLRHCPAVGETKIKHMAHWRKDQNSKFEVMLLKNAYHVLRIISQTIIYWQPSVEGIELLSRGRAKNCLANNGHNVLYFLHFCHWFNCGNFQN